MPEAVAPCPASIVDPALFGIDYPGRLVLIGPGEDTGASPLAAIREAVERGDAVLVHDPEGPWTDCAVARIGDAFVVVTMQGRGTFATLEAALRHGLTSWPMPIPTPPSVTRKACRALRRTLDRLTGARK